MESNDNLNKEGEEKILKSGCDFVCLAYTQKHKDNPDQVMDLDMLYLSKKKRKRIPIQALYEIVMEDFPPKGDVIEVRVEKIIRRKTFQHVFTITREPDSPNIDGRYEIAWMFGLSI